MWMLNFPFAYDSGVVQARGNVRRGFEFKRTTAPAITPSMRIALRDLELERLDVVHAGRESFPLGPQIHAVSASNLSALR